jgi:hypothetical protein
MAIPFMAAALGLAQFVPTIARLLGGEGGERVATQVVDIAKKITGESDASSMISVLKTNPELLIEFQREVIRFEIDLEMSYLQDRQDARWRDMSFVNSGRQNLRADIMVISAAGGLIICLASLAYYSDFLPGEAVGIISTIAGIFGSCLKDAYAFEFGSSRGSKMKDSAVAAMIERSGL